MSDFYHTNGYEADDWRDCKCGRGERYNHARFQTCYECYLDRRADYLDCIFCGKWHSRLYATCFTCRAQSPDRDEAGRRLREDILMRDQYTCRYCASYEGFLQVDHVKPCRLGGTADPWNLQVLCGRCNRDKGTTWPGEGHGKARILLIHQYFTTLWAYLTEEQQQQLREAGDEYDGGIFDHHIRYKPRHHDFCLDCDRDNGIADPQPACWACGQIPSRAGYDPRWEPYE